MSLKLRPHHVINLIQNPAVTSFNSAFIRYIYGKEFYKRFKDLLARAKSGEEITLVEGLDDVCANCPYREPCNSGENDLRQYNLPWFARLAGEFKLLRHTNPKREDEKTLKKLGLDINQTYTLNCLKNKYLGLVISEE